MDHDALTSSEIAMRQVDDLLYLMYMALYVIATECNRSAGIPDPGFCLEQPEDPERWIGNETEVTQHPSWDLQKHRPAEGFASFWSTPEWKALEAE